MKKKIITTFLVLLIGLLFSSIFSVKKVKAACYYLGNAGYGACAGNPGALRCSTSGGGFYACCNQPGDVCPPQSPGGNATPVPPNSGGGQSVPGSNSGSNISPTCQGGGISTAIGCIPVLGDTTGKGLANFLLKWGIGVGSGIAFLLILYAGFMIMTSAGNPERLKAGQELLTSAISGVLLLIFSIFILNFIGIKILGIFS